MQTNNQILEMKNIAKIILTGISLLVVAGAQASAQEPVYPNDPEAFDYGLAPGQTKTADLSAEALADWAVGKNEVLPPPSITVDNITWLASEKNSATYMGIRIVYNRVKAYEKVAGVKVAADMGIRFKINRPGSFSMYPRFMYSDASRAQKFIAVLVTTKNGVTTATRIFEETKPEQYMSTDVKEKRVDDKCRIIFDVTEEMLAGIDEAATIHLWHAADNAENIGHMVSYFPPKWTSAQ